MGLILQRSCLHVPALTRCRCLAICLIVGSVSAQASNRATSYAQSARGSSSSQSFGAGNAADRLYVADLFLTDAIYSALTQERARAQPMCANDKDLEGCIFRESRPLSIHFVRVRSAPSFTAPITGDLLLVGRKSSVDWRFALVYRLAADGSRRTWFRDVDSGYGPHLSGVRSHAGWIGLSGAPFDTDVWIYAGTDHNLQGEASSIAGYVLELHDIRVRTSDGRRRVLSGPYFIVQVDRAGIVSFRQELDIDMPCGEDVSPPSIMPPTFRAPASAFFDADGRPRFELKYTKGC